MAPASTAARRRGPGDTGVVGRGSGEVYLGGVPAGSTEVCSCRTMPEGVPDPPPPTVTNQRQSVTSPLRSNELQLRILTV